MAAVCPAVPAVGVGNGGKYTDFNPSPDDLDLFGNVSLHHSVSHDKPDLNKMKELLSKYPDGAKQKNQFGRIPLHYVVDRCNASVEAVQLLLKAYPEGAYEFDNENVTPYDLAVHWNHSAIILKMLLRADKDQDRETYMRLTYGPLYSLYRYICKWPIAYSQPPERGGISGDQSKDDSGGSEVHDSVENNFVEEFRRSTSIPDDGKPNAFTQIKYEGDQ
mmetsp:Transcript_3300/g.5155  ORF Transcript_3300/g.5155 Transcript_3300/m.5155 type:complete len:219 (-) Transcript_3300:263-919(-)|eukprot:CAMPEP_0185026562 /NCGR_PEP_ID=MMETSP1103-20130426/10929_1 /TAXON_ID=36769 /ORGANISM="Paraphysomonas bandaiensis, Strain Caron Lab Isolate" /LENGTH=218 /DNA_ID=CAMNT_0027560189 /DNA_START=33 /DNA_END=689 /DNA_ORIENTATION=-